MLVNKKRNTNLTPMMYLLIHASDLNNPDQFDWSLESVEPLLEGEIDIRISASNKGVIVPIHVWTGGERYLCRVAIQRRGSFAEYEEVEFMAKKINETYQVLGLFKDFYRKHRILDSLDDGIMDANEPESDGDDIGNGSISEGMNVLNLSEGQRKYCCPGSDFLTLRSIEGNSDACILRVLLAIKNSGYDSKTNKTTVGRVLKKEFGNSSRQYVQLITALDKIGWLQKTKWVILPVLSKEGEKKLNQLQEAGNLYKAA